MKIKKLLIAALVFVCAFTMSGCNIFTVETENLLSPPQLSGDMYPIGQALKKSVKGEYTLTYPTRGDYRSAVILEDITGDNNFEAIAFYSTSHDEITTMNINLILNKDDEWKSVSQISIVAGGVNSVNFCDFDKDGVKEIVVGWEIFGSTNCQLAVYSFGEGVLSQRLLEPYTTFDCCDLNEDGKDEVFIQLLNTAALTNTASVYSVDKTAVKQIGICPMDSTVKTVSEPIVSKLSSGHTAIYVDEVKGAGAITEVLYFSKGELVNPLLNDKDSLENTTTLRQASLSTKDINGDGTLEIPVAYNLPSTDTSGAEVLYYTSWCSFNGESLATKVTAIHNTLDGYYIAVPEKWKNKIAVSKDTENRIRSFYEFDEATQTVGEPLAYIKTMAESEYKGSVYEDSDFTELARSNSLIYLGLAIKSESPLVLSREELKNIFKLFN